MVGHGLLYKEWKQNQGMYIGTIIALSLFIPFRLLIDYFSWKEYTEVSRSSHPLVFQFNNEPFIGIAAIIAGIMAILLIGIERSKGTLDYTLSLPYKRSGIFMTKFALGFAVLIGSIGISYLLSSLIIWGMGAEANYFHIYYLYCIISAAMIFTLVLAAGALTGNPFAQALVAFSTAILPWMLFFLIGMHIYMFSGEPSFFNDDTLWIIAISPITYFVFHQPWILQAEIFIPVGMIILFFIIGLLAFMKHPNERNGYFFLWKQLNLPVQILVMILGIMGFGISGFTTSGESLGGYLIGGFIGALIGFLLGYFLIYKKGKRS
ncbi:ABC transporter permease subunit [Metabacillus arenae]|uniref:ABC transporter permease subunit n=1 Tax=Metabacillus arenae TaxID=2771434 RepID=A0A926RX29_9BACI|nr:ABC transporter permease subunit [Metabacillus arenae]MBD1380210.1 ABC transporter permease subunit [Metabacillus arenae]